MYPTTKQYKEYANAQTRIPVPIVLINGSEVDIISLEFKDPRETFIGGFTSKHITLQIDQLAYQGNLEKATIEPFIQFKGDSTKVPIGKFYVGKEDIEYEEVQKKYTITAYDKAILFDKQYKPMKWPMKGKDFISGICKSVGVEFDSTSISNIPFYERSLRGINVNERELISNRQVVNEFARLNFCSLHINREGKLTFRNVLKENVSETITGFDYKDLKINKSIKPINSVVYEQKDINDPIYKKDQVSIDKYGLTELKMTDNIFVDVMTYEDRKSYVNEMFSMASGFVYHQFESNQIMRPDYDSCDLISYEDMSDNKFKTIITSMSWTWINGGLQGTMGCPELEETLTKYELSGERQKILNIGIDVDRINGEIRSIVHDIGDRSDKETSLTQDMDSISAKVQSISVGTNLILNLNALMGLVNGTYPYYIFNQNGLQTVFQTIQQTRHMGSSIFRVVKDKNSVTGYSKQYEFKGKALASEYAYIVPDTIYSYRCKRTKGNTPMDVYVVEYDSEKKQIKRTKFTLKGQNMIESFSFTPAQMTMWARLEFFNNVEAPFNIAEEMFVRGEPVKWSEDPNEIKNWAKTQLNMIDDTISMSAKRVDSLSSDIHNSGVEINAVEGVTTYGKKFKVMDSNRTRTLMEVVTEGGRDITRAVDFEATNANISGTITTNKLTATGGTVGGYIISGENLIGNDVKLGKNSIDIGNTNLKGGAAADILHISANRLNIGAIRSSGSVEFAIGDETILQKDVNSDFVSARIDMIGPKKSGYAIGDNFNRYSYIFLQNQPNVSSDIRTKYNISNIDARLLDYFEELEEKSFITKHDDLFSFGYIAQDVERILYRYCVDKWGYQEANEWLKKFKLLNKSESYLSLLYNEIGIIMHAVKKRKIDRLEAENKQLRREHDTLVEILKEKGVI